MEAWIREYWLKALFGAIISGCGIWGRLKIRKMEAKLKEQTAFKMGLQALLRTEIVKIYNNSIRNEYCPLWDRDNLQNLYEQYHLLGGNGSVTELMKKVMELPTEMKGSYEEENEKTKA